MLGPLPASRSFGWDAGAAISSISPFCFAMRCCALWRCASKIVQLVRPLTVCLVASKKFATSLDKSLDETILGHPRVVFWNCLKPEGDYLVTDAYGEAVLGDVPPHLEKKP